jgi:hypothetical protein
MPQLIGLVFSERRWIDSRLAPSIEATLKKPWPTREQWEGKSGGSATQAPLETAEGSFEPPLTIKGCAMRQCVFCLFSRFPGFLAEQLPGR